MPCRDDRDECHTYIYRDGYDPQAKKDIQELKAKLNRVTHLLCLTGRARYNKTNIPHEVITWWDGHCKLDKSRGQPW